MADMQHLDFKGRRLRLAWEETLQRVERDDDPPLELEDALHDAWEEWERWAVDNAVCPSCCSVDCSERHWAK